MVAYETVAISLLKSRFLSILLVSVPLGWLKLMADGIYLESAIRMITKGHM